MPPSYLPNNNFSDLFTKYANINYYNRFTYGFITGVSSTIIGFLLLHRFKFSAFKNKIILI